MSNHEPGKELVPVTPEEPGKPEPEEPQLPDVVCPVCYLPVKRKYRELHSAWHVGNGSRR